MMKQKAAPVQQIFSVKYCHFSKKVLGKYQETHKISKFFGNTLQ